MDNERSCSVGGHEVSIRVLRVDGKKMTVGFFRQLPTCDWLTEDAEPDPSLVIWGKVCYRIPRQGNEWLVAERDGRLYRCNFDRPSLSTSMLDFYLRHQPEAADSERKRLERAQRVDFAMGLLEVPQLFVG